MPKTKSQKSHIIEELGKELERQKSIVFVDFQGLKVKDLLSFRRQLKKAGATVKVAKKTLLQKALAAKSIPVDLKKLSGEIAAIFILEDLASAAKAVFQFGKTNEHLKVLGAYGDSQMYESKTLKEIASLPLREQMLSRLVLSIASPLAGFMNVLQGNMKGLVVALSAIANK